jgi:hypothetical protein
MPNSVTLVASSRLGMLVTARLCTCSSGIVALWKFGRKRWPFVISKEVCALLLEPRSQGNWNVSLVILVRSDWLRVC